MDPCQHRSTLRTACGSVLVLVCATACSSRTGPVGAPTSTGPGGPRIVATQSLAPLLPRAVETRRPMPQQGAAQRLGGRIDAALSVPARPVPGTRVEQRPAPAGQVLTVVLWSVGYALPDAAARARVRTDARAVLLSVRRSELAYGAVLLLVTGGEMLGRKKTVGIVVRAKFTRNLVRRTNWAGVPPDRVLGMADDQPAVIAAGYR